MVSTSSWLATAAVLAAAPLAAWQYQRYTLRCKSLTKVATRVEYVTCSEQKERRDAIKLLNKVDLIASEVGVRLLHLETQTKQFIEDQSKPQEEMEEDPAANSTLNSYYHFDSQGNKLKTKWDSYDVDAELERLEKEEQGQKVSLPTKKPVRQTPKVTKTKLLSTAGGIEHEFEAVLAFLDDVRGDEDVKQLRKAIVAKVHKEHFARIDSIRTQLA